MPYDTVLYIGHDQILVPREVYPIPRWVISVLALTLVRVLYTCVVQQRGHGVVVIGPSVGRTWSFFLLRG